MLESKKLPAEPIVSKNRLVTLGFISLVGTTFVFCLALMSNVFSKENKDSRTNNAMQEVRCTGCTLALKELNNNLKELRNKPIVIEGNLSFKAYPATRGFILIVEATKIEIIGQRVIVTSRNGKKRIFVNIPFEYQETR